MAVGNYHFMPFAHCQLPTYYIQSKLSLHDTMLILNYLFENRILKFYFSAT
jgi:hypothetical protein